MPKAIQIAEAWVSDTALVAGTQALGGIAAALSDSGIGLIHITPKNAGRPRLPASSVRPGSGRCSGCPPSTVHAVFIRHGMHRLAWLDRPTGQLIRRYERDRPGELVYVDVKKLGVIREGGGWRVHGRGSAVDLHATAEAHAGRRVGFDYVHCAVDDHTRLAYAEIHPDETTTTCAGFLRSASVFFASVGIGRIERVLTDNAWAYRRGRAWPQALADLGAQGRFTRSYRPQTNGKAERFNRTLADEWA